MPTYARREGGAYARGNVVTLVRHLGRRDLASQGPHGQRREPRVATKIFTDRNIEARRTIDHLGAERAYQGRLLLGRFELDEAHDAGRTAVMHQPEAVHGPVGLA